MKSLTKLALLSLVGWNVSFAQDTISIEAYGVPSKEPCTAKIDFELPNSTIGGIPLTPLDFAYVTVYVNKVNSLDPNTIVQKTIILDVTVGHWETSELPNGNYWIYMTATDNGLRESSFSNVYRFRCPKNEAQPA